MSKCSILLKLWDQNLSEKELLFAICIWLHLFDLLMRIIHIRLKYFAEKKNFLRQEKIE